MIFLAQFCIMFETTHKFETIDSQADVRLVRELSAAFSS